jgi:hypothetical protein
MSFASTCISANVLGLHLWLMTIFFFWIRRNSVANNIKLYIENLGQYCVTISAIVHASWRLCLQTTGHGGSLANHVNAFEDFGGGGGGAGWPKNPHGRKWTGGRFFLSRCFTWITALTATVASALSTAAEQVWLCRLLLLRTLALLQPAVPMVIAILHLLSLLRPCHESGGWSPASHNGGPGSIPRNSKWILWST